MKRRDDHHEECLEKVTLIDESGKAFWRVVVKMGPPFLSCFILVRCCEHFKRRGDPRWVRKYITGKLTL